jgi:hypothetical protein
MRPFPAALLGVVLGATGMTALGLACEGEMGVRLFRFRTAADESAADRAGWLERRLRGRDADAAAAARRESELRGELLADRAALDALRRGVTAIPAADEPERIPATDLPTAAKDE